MKIRAYIGEATEYDKKETLEERRPKSWLKSVSAFANGNGGVLLFGIADDDALKGLPDVKTASEKISEAVKSKMDPIPSIELQIKQEEGKDFILLHVAPVTDNALSRMGREHVIGIETARHDAAPCQVAVLGLGGERLRGGFPLGTVAARVRVADELDQPRRAGGRSSKAPSASMP